MDSVCTIIQADIIVLVVVGQPYQPTNSGHGCSWTIFETIIPRRLMVCYLSSWLPIGFTDQYGRFSSRQWMVYQLITMAHQSITIDGGLANNIAQ